MIFRYNVTYDFINDKYKSLFSGRLSRSKYMEPSLTCRTKAGREYLPLKEIKKDNSDWRLITPSEMITYKNKYVNRTSTYCKRTTPYNAN